MKIGKEETGTIRGEQPREWKMKRLEKKTPGTIRGATKGVRNEKVKKPKIRKQTEIFFR